MKLLTHSTSNSKRFFIPIRKFEFKSFAVRVRQMAGRQSGARQSTFRMSQRGQGASELCLRIALQALHQADFNMKQLSVIDERE